MKLTDLDPHFLKCVSPGHFDHTNDVTDADGLCLLCPACFWSNNGAVGTHSIIVWRPSVPQDVRPAPGRWDFIGTGYADLTLKAGSSSVQITGGCRAHFFIRKGKVDFC